MDFINILSIFVMACFVGYYVVWSVTPALHTPLMAVTAAISSVIIVDAQPVQFFECLLGQGSGWARVT
jgi:H+-translocating NAD(P) transhydrogenase subunit alpha